MNEKKAILDCSNEVCDVQQFQQKAWLAKDIAPSDYLTIFDEPVLEELQTLAAKLKQQATPHTHKAQILPSVPEGLSLSHTLSLIHI